MDSEASLPPRRERLTVSEHVEVWVGTFESYFPPLVDFIGDVSVNGKQGCGTSVKQSPKGNGGSSPFPSPQIRTWKFEFKGVCNSVGRVAAAVGGSSPLKRPKH